MVRSQDRRSLVLPASEGMPGPLAVRLGQTASASTLLSRQSKRRHLASAAMRWAHLPRRLLGLRASRRIRSSHRRKKSLRALASEAAAGLAVERLEAPLALVAVPVVAREHLGLHLVVGLDLARQEPEREQEQVAVDSDLATISQRLQTRSQGADLDLSQQESLAGAATRIRSGEHL